MARKGKYNTGGYGWSGVLKGKDLDEKLMKKL